MESSASCRGAPVCRHPSSPASFQRSSTIRVRTCLLPPFRGVTVGSQPPSLLGGPEVRESRGPRQRDVGDTFWTGPPGEQDTCSRASAPSGTTEDPEAVGECWDGRAALSVPSHLLLERSRAQASPPPQRSVCQASQPPRLVSVTGHGAGCELREAAACLVLTAPQLECPSLLACSCPGLL
ncbi:unnamed protein product [Rangifer tarandus platyrhynchus]|uniref:Uncharacterized protein n=1 Tax=Rangifer tarandus platyrhynchus TaxID=3082113 RepID=A0ABN8ZY88_RANTA|nr:unnamed protein product [Rangifer tarandus platyrhynchus]